MMENAESQNIRNVSENERKGKENYTEGEAVISVDRNKQCMSEER